MASWGYFDNSVRRKDVEHVLFLSGLSAASSAESRCLRCLRIQDYGRMTATIDNKAEVVTSEMVSGNYYRVLGIHPALGRVITDSDDAAVGSGPVMLISDGYWARRFGRTPDMIGKKIEINGTPMTIIGVNPPDLPVPMARKVRLIFFFPSACSRSLLPNSNLRYLADKDLWWVMIMGRMKPGISTETARAAVDLDLNAAVRATMIVGKDDEMPRLELEDGSRGQKRLPATFAKPIYVLMSLAGFVLMLACANLANLLLARASSRQREMSVRLALGAGRARILRQMFTESLLLSIAGGAAGLLLGYLGRNAIPHLLSSSPGSRR